MIGARRVVMQDLPRIGDVLAAELHARPRLLDLIGK